ncbi:MAG: hypothetical protein JSW47_20050 [Phycisphaerales bacterium]|nr:MAG: hypothetical protein JSW47_20050 [Phycisphaerales bacterium]
MPAREYAAEVVRLAPLMKKVDPSIKLLACGSGGLSRRSANGMPYNRTVLERCATVLDYISIHHYENPDRFVEGPRDFEAFFRELGRIIESSSNPNLKIYVSEWNAQSTDWRTGLYCGGLLNAFERCSDILTLAGPALFLRHVSASAWDNAFINFDGESWFAAPNYLVMKLYRDHFASQLLSVTGQAGGLNVSAGKSEDGERIILKVVNPTGETIETSFELEGSFKAKQAILMLIAPGSLRAGNSLGQRDVVKAEERSVWVESGGLCISVPRWSVGVVEIRE